MMYKLTKNYVFSEDDEELFLEEAKPIIINGELDKENIYYINTGDILPPLIEVEVFLEYNDKICDITKIVVAANRYRDLVLYNVSLGTDISLLIQHEDFDNIMNTINK